MRLGLLAVLVLLTACGEQKRVAAGSSYDLKATKRCLQHLDPDAFVHQESEAERLAEEFEIPPLEGTILWVTFGAKGEFDTAYMGLAPGYDAAKRFAGELGKGTGAFAWDRIRQHGSVITWGFLELQPKVERKMLDCVKRS